MKLPRGKKLKKGDTGDLVGTLQEHLKKCGYKLRGKNGGVDKDFGESTDAAVRYFQSCNPALSITGIVDEATARQLDICAALTAAAAKAAEEKVGYDVPTFIIYLAATLGKVSREWLAFIERWGACLSKRGHKKEHLAALIACLKALASPKPGEVIECMIASGLSWKDLTECYSEAF